jgi:predicted Ser/Thr protein kinase
MQTKNNFENFLRSQGYSERAIAEICRWYVSSTTKNQAAKLRIEMKN